MAEDNPPRRVQRRGRRPLTEKAPGPLELLSSAEAATVLRQLLAERPDLESDVSRIATSLIADISSDAIATDLSLGLRLLDHDDLNARSGPTAAGYVDPTDAAWELLDEVVRPDIEDMERSQQLGFHTAAMSICIGIVIGLHDAATTGGAVLDWAPDFPLEMARQSVDALVNAMPEAERDTARERVLAAIAKSGSNWSL
jgi:hypothetical protein